MAHAVGVMAHDEGANIATALRSILAQRGPHVGAPEVVVVASGCTDDTVPRVREVAATEPRIALIEQPRREGKASAINLFLDRAADAPVLVLAGGDTRLAEGALEALLAPFDDPGVGMTGGRPVPVNSTGSLLGRVVQLQWCLHDAIARRSPKLGELVAFRRAAVRRLDEATAVDEASIEAAVAEAGLRRVYVPEARVAMKGPSTLSDFLAQRRRIHAGHLALRRATGHAVSTMSPWAALRAAAALAREGRTTWTTVLASAALESFGRALGFWDARIARRDLRAWSRVASTKDLTP
ncbi:MAG TPA: glycosyltransferase [Candidatus Polarisedimenticolaceae bacterium]|nr:glycosyltransferase [Candidatus Polarisedimenticolaceae bacterium]